MSTETWTLTDITPEYATVTIKTGDQTRTLIVPAVLPDPPEAGKAEEIKVGEKTYKCAVYHYTTKSVDELGRNGQGLAGTVTLWIAPEVPGGIVQRQVSLTIRVSYNTLQTLQLPKKAEK